jgi:hypothetical protein
MSSHIGLSPRSLLASRLRRRQQFSATSKQQSYSIHQRTFSYQCQRRRRRLYSHCHWLRLYLKFQRPLEWEWQNDDLCEWYPGASSYPGQ